MRTFLKQPNRRLQQLLAVENKTILQQLKLSNLYMMFHLTLTFYPHHTGMRSQMFYTNGSFQICQEQIFVKQSRKHGWSSYLLPKKIFVLKQKSSILYMVGFNSVRKFLGGCLSTLHYKPLPKKCNVTIQSATWLQLADLISALGETRAWLQAKPPWLQAKYTMVPLKCSPDHTVRQITL